MSALARFGISSARCFEKNTRRVDRRFLKYNCELFRRGLGSKDAGHAGPLASSTLSSTASRGLGAHHWQGRALFDQHPSVSTARPIVAVIEANATDRHTLRSLLSALDVDVHDYDSAESYLAADGGQLSCVITDVALPGMSGLELLRLLRTSRISPPVILLGEEADVSAAVAAMREGAVDFIEKPRIDLAIVRRVAYLVDHARGGLTH